MRYDQFAGSVAPEKGPECRSREAVMYLDWPLVEVSELQRLVLKKGLRFGTGSPSRMEVLLRDDSPDATNVALNAKYPGGVGRSDERTLQSLINTVRNAMEVLARRRLEARAGGRPASDLRQMEESS